MGNSKASKVVWELYAIEFFIRIRGNFVVGLVECDGGKFLGIIKANVARFSSNGRALGNIGAPSVSSLVTGNPSIFRSELLPLADNRRDNIVVNLTPE